MKVQIAFGAWPPVAVAQLESLGRLRAVSPFIIVIASITAIVMLAAQIVALASAIIKYRKVNPTPIAPSATDHDRQIISRRILWREVGRPVIASFSIGMIISLIFSKQPMTASDVGVASLAIIIFVSTLYSKPSA